MSTEPQRTPPQATLTDAVPSARAGAPKPKEFEALADRERRNPFLRWLMHLGVPMIASLCFHGTLLLGMAFYTVYRVHAKIDVGDYNAGIVDSDADLMKNAFEWKEPEIEKPPEEKLDQEPLSDLSNLSDLDVKDVDTGKNDDSASIGEGALSLLGTGEGAGESGTGGFGSGLGAGGARRGQAGMWGVNVEANKVVFVIDYSGSIIVAADDVKRELKRAVGSLKPFQTFSVVLFYGGGASEQYHVDAFSPKLEPAQEEVRKRFFTWIDKKEPQGGTEPVEAMRRAIAMKPEAIFFMSDGDFDNNDVAAITDANKNIRAKVLSIVFDEALLSYTGSLPPKESDGARRMKVLAEQNRGQTHIVTGNDLRRK